MLYSCHFKTKNTSKVAIQVASLYRVYVRVTHPRAQGTNTNINILCPWLIKPASEYNILGQTQIFVSNIKFEFVRQSNILFGFANICNKDMYVTLRASGWLSPSNRTPSCPTSAPVGSPLRWSFILTI